MSLRNSSFSNAIYGLVLLIRRMKVKGMQKV
jgi:hypothetical protein